MSSRRPSLLNREDTFLGVCEGLGEDLGVSPLLLRLGFALALFFNPLATVAAYLGLGVVLAVARWRYPVSAAGNDDVRTAVTTPASGDDQDWIELAEAA